VLRLRKINGSTVKNLTGEIEEMTAGETGSKVVNRKVWLKNKLKKGQSTP